MRVIVAIGVILAVLAALGAMGAGLGHRWELWPVRTAFTVLRWSAYAGVAAGVLSLIGVTLTLRRKHRRGLITALIGVGVAAAVVTVPYAELRQARSVPPIHDITTDTDEPPLFVAILPLRADAPNPAAYAGPEVAAQQREAYPDIEPARLHLEPHEAYARALDTAKLLGWQIVAAVPGEGRIEAVDESFWFGFRDDVVVRIRSDNGGSRVDVRSVSRVGRSDIGANARRIRRFLHDVRRWDRDR